MARVAACVVSLGLLPAMMAATGSYTNPIINEPMNDLGDPGALFFNGSYYIATSTGDKPNAFPIHRSTDLVSWTHVGYVFPQWAQNKNPKWALGEFWAPDLQYINGRFVCYFSAKQAGWDVGPLGQPLSLGVAFSDSPEGPYTDALGRPLLQDKGDTEGTIDVHFHQASNGTKYLIWKANQNPVWSSAHIMMQELAENGTSLVGAPWSLITADQAWEEWGCVEAPWMLEHNGTYYLFYSASIVNFNTYAIGVARSNNVAGPYVKRGLPIMHQCGYAPPIPPVVTGRGICPGHCSILPIHDKVDRYVMFYHGKTREMPNRTVNMDELHWGEDGWPYITGDCPSATSLPVP